MKVFDAELFAIKKAFKLALDQKKIFECFQIIKQQYKEFKNQV